MADRIDIGGGCHCRNLGIHLRWPEPGGVIAVRRCGCSFCRKHGGAWTSSRDAALEIAVQDETRLSRYRFGTATADFLVCADCGVVPAVVCSIDGRDYAVVNVNTFNDIGSLTLDESPTDFDGEGVGDRLKRRKRNWIPDVRINGAARRED